MSNNGKKGKINRVNPKQKLAITHLSNGKSVSESAQLVGVTRQTINNWMNSSDFRTDYEQAVENQTIQVSERYFRAEKKAFDVLHSIMLSKKAKDADKIRAALEIQKQSQKLREFFLLESRVSKLESRIVINDSKELRPIVLSFGNTPPMQQSEEDVLFYTEENEDDEQQ